MTDQNNDPLSLDDAVEAFKAEFVTEDGLVLNAWANGEFIVVYIDGMKMTDEDLNPNPEMDKIPAPGEYEGHPTVLTLLDDREGNDDDTVVFEED